MTFDGTTQFITEHPALTTGLLSIGLIVLARYSVIIYRRYQRHRYCKQIGHDLNEKCLCRRCRMRTHNYVEVKKETWTEERGGALDLDSNFQPDTIRVTVEYLECTRCKASLTRTTET